MEQAQQLLEMIEDVLPEHTAKLDEIDVWAYCYFKKLMLAEVWTLPRRYVPRYTRSRDKLKGVRPEGRLVLGSSVYDARKWACSFELKSDPAYRIDSGFRPTEELAELHAIIQATARERAAVEVAAAVGSQEV